MKIIIEVELAEIFSALEVPGGLGKLILGAAMKMAVNPTSSSEGETEPEGDDEESGAGASDDGICEKHGCIRLANDVCPLCATEMLGPPMATPDLVP